MTQALVFPGDHLIAASTPGGMARHYRVQLLESNTQTWRMYCAFRYIDQANACAADLRSHGFDARVVQHRICPVAA